MDAAGSAILISCVVIRLGRYGMSGAYGPAARGINRHNYRRSILALISRHIGQLWPSQTCHFWICAILFAAPAILGVQPLDVIATANQRADNRAGGP